MAVDPPESIPELIAALEARAYLADRGLATAIHLALHLPRPLLLEGDAGVGKTETARVLANMLEVPLIRLQCYEGIDAAQALYEWDHPRQLLHLRSVEAAGRGPAEGSLYSEAYLLERPLLQALRAGGRAVLLIDEIDRADDEFEAFLLEFLADFQVSIPELGTVRAAVPPVVVLTSNRTRELHDALRRRCLYYWIDHPTVERLLEILQVRAPDVASTLLQQVADVVVRIRDLDLARPPAVAEAIDWARALALLDVDHMDWEDAVDTLPALVKERDDLQAVRAAVEGLLS